MVWLIRIGLILLLLLITWLWWVLSGSVPGKQVIRQRLLGLGKNAPLRANGLQTLTIAWQGGEAELTYLHVPRRDGAPGGAPDGVPDPLPNDVPAVVLIHPTPHTLATWSEVLFGEGGGPGLAGRVDVYALEIIGHGMTTTPWPKDGGFQTGADWIAAALQALDLHDVCLVGQSYGGEFAWRCALDHPELVGRLVLLDSSGFAREDGDWLPEEKVMRSNPLAGLGYALNARERVRGALQVHFGEPVSDDRVEEVFQVCESADNWRAMIDLVRDENGDRAQELAKLTQPTLLLWGARDLAYDVERYGRRFAATIPDARLEIVDDSGHYPQEEQPAAVVRALEAFLAAR